MKKLIPIVLLLIFFPISVIAFDSPNNKFGIHLASPHEEALKEAANLVNSNNGRWGYITLVIQENDRDINKWQTIFDHLRELHLIPIVRLATRAEGENWRRPEKQDIKDWVIFLDSLNWVVKNRYVVLFNEPNHASEWGGEVDVRSFTEVTFEFSKKLKEKNQDFFIMIAGFDASAPSWPPGMEDEEVFLQKMINLKSEIFNYIDGLASHSYPNPGFAGSPLGWGRGTVRTYQWELDLLRSLGVSKELPVFITETGWKRGSETVVANYFQTAFEEVWNKDNQVKAVTPFILDYQGDPFLDFSWKRFNSSEFYQQYYTVQSLSKIKGIPEQINKGTVSFSLPKELVVQSKYNFKIVLNNLGQAVWDKDDDYEVTITTDGVKNTENMIADLKDIKPGEEKEVEFSIKTQNIEGNSTLIFHLIRNGNEILNSSKWQINILPLPDLVFETNFFPFGKAKGNDFEIQIFDIDDRLVYKKKNIDVDKGVGEVKSIQNIALDELYRVVILKPGYLPRQKYLVFKKDNNKVEFKSLLPFDLNHDGKLDLSDLFKLFGR